jgi:DNA-binding MarR family transcriptional regulator
MISAITHHGHEAGLHWWGWLIGIGILVGLVLIATLVHRHVRQSDGLSRAERRDLTPHEAEVLAMLRQTGRPLSQVEIADILPMDVEDIAEAAQHLEERALILRQWSSEQRTYIITPA